MMESGKHKALTLATMCIATFVAILDTTVVNLALHTIQSQLHTSVRVLQWVLDLYNLSYASFIMTGGVLGDLFGRRRIFVLGMCLFTLGSLVCGLAPTASILIAGRGVAGIGAALQLPGSLSILNVAFQEEKERAHAIAIWGGFDGLAMAIGPTAGGLLVGHFGWRSVFFLVVPFGIVVIGNRFRLMHVKSPHQTGPLVSLVKLVRRVVILRIFEAADAQLCSTGTRPALPGAG